jgi:FemAB-related protein (PEP-CTERM system-associated)
MKNLEVRALNRAEPLRIPESLWDAATFTALDSWSQLVEKIYGYTNHRFQAVENGSVTGILTLTEVKHPIFGHYLATSPFGSYGGFAFSSTEARDRLLETAKALANALNVDYVIVRFDAGGESLLPDGWAQHSIYSTYRVDLNPDVEQLMLSFSSDHRNHIRKSMKKGFSIQFGRLDLLDDAYEGLARSMHELGSPYHDKDYLRQMAQALGDALEFLVVRSSDNELVGVGALIAQGNVLTNLHANILRNFRSDYAGEFLYWSVIQRYTAKGFKEFDLGRSLVGSGNEVFKMKWKPRRVPLAYWYYLPQGGEIPELNQKSPKFQLAIWLWKRLPAFAVRALGPQLIRGIV